MLLGSGRELASRFQKLGSHLLKVLHFIPQSSPRPRLRGRSRDRRGLRWTAAKPNDLGEFVMTGILVIWNDCATGRENAYEEWYQDEHLIERLRVSGFQIGRRYEAISATRKFFTTYEV